MPDTNETPPVVIPANAAWTDTLQAALRLIMVVVTAIPLMITLLGKHDVVAIILYFQSADGVTLISAATGLGAMTWGLLKTLHRARQAVSVAADPRTPDAVSSLK